MEFRRNALKTLIGNNSGAVWCLIQDLTNIKRNSKLRKAKSQKAAPSKHITALPVKF